MWTREDLTQAVGALLGTSAFVDLTQERIATFADVTEDWQDIHLDVEAGRAAGFGGTVAHGFLTLSMLSAMARDVLPDIDGQRASVNYGFDRIRFVAPVAGGARVRGHFVLEGVEPRGGDLLLRLDVTVEIEGAARPALQALWRILYLF